MKRNKQGKDVKHDKDEKDEVRNLSIKLKAKNGNYNIFYLSNRPHFYQVTKLTKRQRQHFLTTTKNTRNSKEKEEEEEKASNNISN